jgi:hypothetical protein
MANEALGNVLSRLQGLKNVSARRVKNEPDFLQNLQEEDTDVSGTAQPLPNFANFQTPTSNLPESDLGGELTPQSYDVRANTIQPDESQEQPGFFSKLGQALADYISPTKRAEMSERNSALFNRGQQQSVAQTPPIETAQVDMQEGLPPVTASQEAPLRAQPPEQSSGIMGAISDYFNPTKRSQMGEYTKDLMQDAQIRGQGKNPDEVRLQAQETQNLTHDQKKAVQEPWKYAAFGSAEQVANSPALSAQFKQITGLDYEPQIAAQVAQHEEAMKGVEDSLNGLNTQLSDQAEGIKQRILNNQTNDADKYFIGMALLMPLLIGGIFGKEAGLGALGGAAKGFADVLGGRQKSIREDEASLLDLSKQQSANQEKLGNIGLEKAKLGPALRKMLPENPNAHLEGMREGIWENPETGEEVRGVEIKPGLIARPEFLATKEGKADMLKAANELSEVKTYVDEVNDLTEDVIKIVTQLEDPSFAWKGLTSILSGKSPTILAKMTQDVDVDGRKVNAGVALEEKLGFLANAYGMAKEIGQLDRAAQNHIKKIVENPTSTFLTPADSLNQILEVRKLAQRGLVRGAANKGFYPEFVIRDMEQVNNPLFQGLNESEDQKYNEQLKRKAFQGEMNYAQ